MRALHAVGLLILATVLADPAGAETARVVAVAKPPPNNERRIALVIGNSAYKSSPLKNPVNDARAMAKVLSEAGFSVRLVEDARRAGMHRAIREFGDAIARGGVGLFYFAGHGMQVRARNYLVPVDVEIEREDEVEFQAIDANLVLSKMDSARNAANIVILDACRNNPFTRSFKLAATGLAQMDAPSGTLIAFATAPGQVAADGDGENGIYTRHLLANLAKPMPVEQLFKQVRNGVMADTGERQVPWESSSLRSEFYFTPIDPGIGAAVQKAAIDRAVSDAVKQTEDRAARERQDLEAKLRQLIDQLLAKQRADHERELAARGSAPVALAGRGDPVRLADAAPAPAATPPLAGQSAPKPAPAIPIVAVPAPAPVAATSSPPATRKPEPDVERAPPKPLPAAPIISDASPAQSAATAAPLPEVNPGVPVPQIAALASSPFAKPASVQPGLPKAGSYWVYRGRRIDQPTQEWQMKATVKAVTATEVLDSVGNVNRKATDWVHGAGPYFVGQSGYWQFSPYIGVFGGLKEGAQWSGFDYQNVGICSRDPTCSISAKVAGREKVQVPAGTFEAWKVVVDYRFRVQNVVAAREFTYWYADEIKRFVKYTTRGNAPWDTEVDIDLLLYELD